MKTFSHTGDLGDIIAALPSIRALGGGRLVIFDNSKDRRESLKGARFDSIAPLLEAQPYIAGVEWSDSKPKATDFSEFRNDHKFGESLAHWQARHVGATISVEPWLTVKPSDAAKGRVVISRSSRYHSPHHMWGKVLSRNKDALFVGLPAEHEALQSRYGAKIDYLKTDDLLELAQVIAGCRLFIGNQSCPWWIAFALGVPTIQEVWPHSPNSRIERAGARYFDVPPFAL